MKKYRKYYYFYHKSRVKKILNCINDNISLLRLCSIRDKETKKLMATLVMINKIFKKPIRILNALKINSNYIVITKMLFNAKTSANFDKSFMIIFRNADDYYNPISHDIIKLNKMRMSLSRCNFDYDMILRS